MLFLLLITLKQPNFHEFSGLPGSPQSSKIGHTCIAFICVHIEGPRTPHAKMQKMQLSSIIHTATFYLWVKIFTTIFSKNLCSFLSSVHGTLI